MGGKQQAYAALLRGINVSGRRPVPMAELRSLLADVGWNGVRTYIQSGNVVFTSAAPAAGLERQLEKVIEQQFGFSVPVVVRSASRWARYIEGLPFPEETKLQANWVLLVLSKEPPVGNGP